MSNKGQEVFKEFTSGTKKYLTTKISDIAPNVEEYIINFVLDDIYVLEGLSNQGKL